MAPVSYLLLRPFLEFLLRIKGPHTKSYTIKVRFRELRPMVAEIYRMRI